LQIVTPSRTGSIDVMMSHAIGCMVTHAMCHLVEVATVTDTVAIDEVSCYNFIVRLRSLPWFAEMVSQGYCSVARLGCEYVQRQHSVVQIRPTAAPWTMVAAPTSAQTPTMALCARVPRDTSYLRTGRHVSVSWRSSMYTFFSPCHLVS